MSAWNRGFAWRGWKTATSLLLLASVISIIIIATSAQEPNDLCILFKDSPVQAEINKTFIDRVDTEVIKPAFAFLKQPIIQRCRGIMLDLVGQDGNERKVENSPFFNFTQGYHTLGIPAVDYWSEAHGLFQDIRPALVNIGNMLRDYDEIKSIGRVCSAIKKRALSFFNQPQGDANKKLFECREIAEELLWCLNQEILMDIHPSHEEMDHRFLTACSQAPNAFIRALLSAVRPLRYNRRNPRWYYSPFGIMIKDTDEFDDGVKERVDNSFPKYIAELAAAGNTEEAQKLQERLDEIKSRLQDPSLPYHHIYFAGDAAKRYGIRTLGDDFAGGNGFKNFREKIEIFYFGTETVKGFLEYWRDWTNREYFLNDLIDEAVSDLVDNMTDIYNMYVKVKRLPPGASMYNDNGTLVGDGKWDWKPDMNGLHNLRLAWDLMGAVLEELKCYMKDTYYFDLRQKAIKATQQDLKKGALFSGISHTMLTPCRIDYNDESDLVTKYCTKENHEICMPLAPFHSLQRPESPQHGGLALLRPRWIFKYEPAQGKCVGRKDYVMLMSVCRCGFRLDCGEDLNAHITCQLQNNDRLRGQCRGSVAYPCKTLPLAPGMYNQSCVSGYCNELTNSCEDAPYIYDEVANARGAPAWKRGKVTLGQVGFFTVLVAIPLLLEIVP